MERRSNTCTCILGITKCAPLWNLSFGGENHPLQVCACRITCKSRMDSSFPSESYYSTRLIHIRCGSLGPYAREPVYAEGLTTVLFAVVFAISQLYTLPPGAVLVSFVNIGESSQSPSVTVDVIWQPLSVSRTWEAMHRPNFEWEFTLNLWLQNGLCIAFMVFECEPFSPTTLIVLCPYISVVRVYKDESSSSLSRRLTENLFAFHHKQDLACMKSPAFHVLSCHN